MARGTFPCSVLAQENDPFSFPRQMIRVERILSLGVSDGAAASVDWKRKLPRPWDHSRVALNETDVVDRLGTTPSRGRRGKRKNALGSAETRTTDLAVLGWAGLEAAGNGPGLKWTRAATRNWLAPVRWIEILRKCVENSTQLRPDRTGCGGRRSF